MITLWFETFFGVALGDGLLIVLFFFSLISIILLGALVISRKFHL